MKPFALAMTLAVYTLTAYAAAADDPSTDAVTAEATKPKKPKRTKPPVKPASTTKADPEKVVPPTEAAAPKSPDAAPVPLETLPPAPAAPPPPPPPPASTPMANPDAQAADPTSSSKSTRLEAIVGRTQAFGFAFGVRSGHRMSNNVYIGGTAMMQTSVPGAVVTYPAMELGYDAKLGAARFMPYVGVGSLFLIPTAVAAPVQVAPLLYPGFALRYESDRSPLTAGADVRFLYLTDKDVSAFAFNLSVGVKF